ncbi:hypothetical protein [Pseudomarimonas salicorniae]|uniref:Methyltransferase, FkbM family n=1 Tax=Pseudomarimonas salicorniae TaxID=2933270 RepID=A0ABT0GCL9_9GAMM|nr:hypothetical protein [Lysobacter sp. CAU 1642]MCK7592282.1 hypothetical protein [Lysobacter sp. CAU 1642]
MSDPIPVLRDRLLSTSGGLQWHATAWRRRAAWAGFVRQVAGWLDAWRPRRDHLVVVGGSAGYTLPTAWLSRFRRITLLEPDPVARCLWRWRRPRAEMGRLDALVAGGLRTLRVHHPDAAVLFANVLGQVPCPGQRRWTETLAADLDGLPWASYHDVFSCVERAATRTPMALPQAGDVETLVAHFWPGLREIELFDHDSLGLGGPGPHAYAPWSLRPGQEHLIEWCVRGDRESSVACPGRSARPAC